MSKGPCGGNVGTGMHVQGFGRRSNDDIVSVTITPIEEPRPEPKLTKPKAPKKHPMDSRFRFVENMKVWHKNTLCTVYDVTSKKIVIINALGKRIELDKDTVYGDDKILKPVINK